VIGIVQVAANILGGNIEECVAFRYASTHCIFHTVLEKQMNNIDDFRYVQQVSGYADIKAMMIYSSLKMHPLYGIN